MWRWQQVYRERVRCKCLYMLTQDVVMHLSADPTAPSPIRPNILHPNLEPSGAERVMDRSLRWIFSPVSSWTPGIQLLLLLFVAYSLDLSNDMARCSRCNHLDNLRVSVKITTQSKAPHGQHSRIPGCLYQFERLHPSDPASWFKPRLVSAVATSPAWHYACCECQTNDPI